MKHAKHAILILVIVLTTTCVAMADENLNSGTVVSGLLSPDPAVVAKSVASLRQEGPAGLEAALELYDKSPDARLVASIDAIAAQHDAISSRLYWYTDLDAAKGAAHREHMPILYLRLMGKLTDEYSCANSRFFRTVLYANADVSKLLREQFVLVWCSERPVPVITIDYGDGRVLKRTITGNSIHYLLNADGRVIDALPGLYGPATFAGILAMARPFAMDSRGFAFGAYAHLKYLDTAQDALLRQWQADLGAANPELLKPALKIAPTAVEAAPMSMSKMVVEQPLLRQLSPQFASALDASIDSADIRTWEEIAALHAGEDRLDASSIALMRSQNPAAYPDPQQLDRTVEKFERLITQDTVRNNYQFRRQILGWLRQSNGRLSLDDLNRRVYSELFLTPRSDPWLGLAPAGDYCALSGDGVCGASPRN